MINCFKDLACLHSCIQLFVILWTIAHQDPLSMEFSRQEYWSGLPFPFLGDLPDPGIKPAISRISCIGRQILYHSVTWEWRRQWHPTPALLPGKLHGWRSLVGCSPWGR